MWVKKLDCPRLRLVNLPTFGTWPPSGGPFPIDQGTLSTTVSVAIMPKSNAQRGKEFRERNKKKKKNLQQVQSKKQQQEQKNRANSSSATAKSRSEYLREYQARKKTMQNTLLMPS
ncbi:hypothetical protein TNCV_4174191 [Trichonephila clavipes]|nr:hypothetical protein TNCV_4174191 [Trichonephila clavipes]